MVLQACLNGDRTSGVPRSPQELGAEARACVAAGAQSIHAHPRDGDGHETLDGAHIAAAVRELRTCGVEISLSTGLWITAGDVDARLRAVRGWTDVPDLVSLNLSEEGWHELAGVLTGHGIGIEAGVWTAADAERLLASGLDVRRILVEPRTESSAEAVAIADEIDLALDEGGSTVRRLHHGVGPATWAVLDAAVPRGHDIRVGLEDVTTLPDGRRAPDNAALVVEAVLRYR
ncbi:3-keto-5-aminohexanoate cleavage protein [Solirubrobacter sp. CPCC 204708]|uniref:3-keto-5-aminohexanoate cleavage protein n=1 Tax=Solirubrobacter deserti TaxID=2282478 RepID=A0ABT4RG86_9ACTN|nr:3-keto-5-aminohexanoate cleavage protein [Solirubrobacter deserti]MBE2318113.1 3-keto-5-aminohexanoate cleavage protein [Solirubrobacter deserti]MDA0137391.1 3-keto-5-aminohexanoate cleavage protein [Solirubrobacter deserti]